MYVHFAERSNVVVYAVVGSVLVSILGIIALVTGAIIIKHKKESYNMRKQQVLRTQSLLLLFN
jgi:membrane-bound ClpP family serine protease